MQNVGHYFNKFCLQSSQFLLCCFCIVGDLYPALHLQFIRVGNKQTNKKQNRTERDKKNKQINKKQQNSSKIFSSQKIFLIFRIISYFLFLFSLPRRANILPEGRWPNGQCAGLRVGRSNLGSSLSPALCSQARRFTLTVPLSGQEYRRSIKCINDQTINSYFSLDFNTMLTKHHISQVLSLDFKTTPIYFNWNFSISWSAITNFKILRELERGENDVKNSLV